MTTVIQAVIELEIYNHEPARADEIDAFVARLKQHPSSSLAQLKRVRNL